jgi:hypothetical protein
LCFADFENSFQTTLVINTLQGYRFDKEDILGLQFTYANKLGNQMHTHGAKGDNAKDHTPNNNNNNSIANQTVHSGSAAGHSGAEASSTSKDGGPPGGVGKSVAGNEPVQNS